MTELTAWNRDNHACYSNEAMNSGERKFHRVGSCDDCNGRCCQFTAGIVWQWNGVTYDYRWESAYAAGFGELVIDRWTHEVYVVHHHACRHCLTSGMCNVFEQPAFPEACRQFPSTPYDFVYRYLMLVGSPCGFRFVDADTGVPWDIAVARNGEREAMLAADKPIDIDPYLKGYFAQKENSHERNEQRD